MGGSQGLVFLSLPHSLSRFPERCTADRVVCVSRPWATTCCNLKWCREQQSCHKSPWQLPNSFSGLEREAWPLTAQVLVYSPGLPALPLCWPLPSVWVCVSRYDGLWNLTWCTVERWPDYHWPLVCSEWLHSRTVSLCLAGGWGWGSHRGLCPLSRGIAAHMKNWCCSGSNTCLIHIKTFWVEYMFWVICLRLEGFKS